MCIQDYLQSRRVPFETMLHRPAASASRRARCAGVPGRRVAKAVLLEADGRPVLAVLPATHRIDLSRLAGAICCRSIRLATEEETHRVFFDCERGSRPPFGALYGVSTLVDESLAEDEDVEIVIDANLRHEGLRLRFRDFRAVEVPEVARFAEPIAPPRHRARSRKAG